MSFKFKPEDFNNVQFEGGDKLMAENVTKVASAKLAEWLSTGVKVYGYKDKEYPDGKNWLFDCLPEGPSDCDTHEALLVNIKPIERECTEHVAAFVNVSIDETTAECKKCGKSLKATWSVVDE